MSELAVGRAMEILLVEDSLLDARITMEALRESGLKHRLTLVRDGEECVEFLAQQGRFSQAPRPDLVLLDLNLPKLSGFELLQRLSESDKLQRVPVVVLTGEDGADIAQRCEGYHVQSLLRKPVNIENFLATVQSLRRDWLQDVLLPETKS